MRRALGFALLLAACDDGVRCPIGTTRLGEVCRVDTADSSMGAAAEAAVNGGEAGATTGTDSGSTNTTGTDSGSTNTTGNQNEAGIDGGGDLTCPTDCNTPAKSRCDGKTGMCVACSNSSQCRDFSDTPVCKASTGCVQPMTSARLAPRPVPLSPTTTAISAAVLAVAQPRSSLRTVSMPTFPALRAPRS